MYFSYNKGEKSISYLISHNQGIERGANISSGLRRKPSQREGVRVVLTDFSREGGDRE